MIIFKNVSKKFQDNIIYEDLNLTINDAESLVIIGQSGVGKSVLLKHIIGLMLPDSGSVIVDNANIEKTTGNKLLEIRKKFGFVFQGGALFDSMNVKENISLALREHTKLNEKEINKKVAEKLELVGLAGTENLMPVELSGGMRKRVSIARAIVMDPAYILYDEPTTGLDPILAQRINQLIVNLNEHLKVTGIVVTHDIASAYAIASRIAMLFKGKIIFTGTPDEASKSNNPYVNQFLKGNIEGPIIIGEKN